MEVKMTDLKELEGQCWSSWKKIVGNSLSDTETKGSGKVNRTDAETSCMKLPRSDMAIFGLCPKTEVFQLIVCKLCGQKSKLPAFAEHIRVHHSSNNTQKPSIKFNKLETNFLKKTKLKKIKDKSKTKEKNGIPCKTVVNSVEVKIDFMDIVSDRQSLPLESETVSKFKQINLKINKKSHKPVEKDNCTEDFNLLNKGGNTCISKKESISEISCKNSTDPSGAKSHVKLGDSAIAQGGEIRNMQPIVQLSPIPTNTSLLSTNSIPNALPVREEKSSTPGSHPTSNAAVEKTSNTDSHSGVVNKENTKPIQQTVNSNAHLISLKKIVQGRNKTVEVCLADKKQDNEINQNSEQSYSTNLSKLSSSNTPSISKNSPVNTQPSPSTSSSLRNDKTESLDECETKNKVTKRVNSEKPRLSLPVSIKNPTILCQLQNKVIKTNFSLPVEAARNESIQDVIKRTFVQKQIRNSRVIRPSKENTRLLFQKKEGAEGTDSTDIIKEDESKLEKYEQWHPGFRRIGGLLYASHTIPCVNHTSAISNSNPLMNAERTIKTVQPNFHNLSEKHNIIDLCNPSSQKMELKKFQFEIECGGKKTVTPLPKQKGHVIMSTPNSRNSIQKPKIGVNPPINSNSKTVICKRVNSNINGAVPAKIKKQDGLMSIVGPVFTKNDHSLPVMHLKVANNVFEKQILAPAQHVPSQNTLGTSVQTGVNVIRGSSLRIGPPRIHYITASGPLPVSIQQVASVQQLQLKPMRVQPKYQLVSPQVNISPTSGVFYIQKAPTNSSSVNGIEER